MLTRKWILTANSQYCYYYPALISDANMMAGWNSDYIYSFTSVLKDGDGRSRWEFRLLDGNFDFVAAYGCYGKFNLYILVTIYDTYARMLTSTYHKVIPRTCSCFLRYLHIADVRYGLLHPETYLGLGWYFSRVRKKSLYVQGVGMRREFRYDSDCWPNSVSQQTTKE